MLRPTLQRFWCSYGILAFLVMTVGVLPHIKGDNNKAETIATITKTWRDRQSRARSLDFVAVGTEFRPSRTFSVSLLEAMGRPSENAISIPDTSFNIRLRLAINGNGQFRMDYDGKAPAPSDTGYPDEHLVEIFENGVRNIIFPVGAFGYPNAHIKQETIPTGALNPHVLPIRIVYRPFDSEIGVFDANKLILTNDMGVVEDRPCRVLKHLDHRIWVDQARDFIPTRYSEIKHGITTRRIDIKYTADVEHGWVPTSWTNVSLENGNTTESVSATVKEYRIGQPISKDTFEVKYPPGTWVRDYITDESYILREDGTRRMVPHSEDGKDYQYLLHTNPPSEHRRLHWLYPISILLLVIFIAVLFRRKKATE